MSDLACPNVNDTIALPLVPPGGGPAVARRYVVDRFLGAGQFGSVLRCRRMAVATASRSGGRSGSSASASTSATEGDSPSASETASLRSLDAIDPERLGPDCVALKWVTCPHADRRSFGTLAREVRVLRRIGAHPHVVQMHHAWGSLKHHTLAIVLEYCAGGDLKAYLRQFRATTPRRRGPTGGAAAPSATGEPRRAAFLSAKAGAEAGAGNGGQGEAAWLVWTLPQATAQELTRQVAEGMLFIWSKGCVHR